MELKTRLRELKEQPANVSLLNNLDALLEEMLQNIGTTDSELRDKLIYSTFSQLIIGNHLNKPQLLRMIEVCLDDQHLFYKIGEKNTDSVFTRSFSSLVIDLILEKDMELNFLEKHIAKKAYKKTILYLQKEEDTRGFVDGKGWAHSIAHGADLLTSTIKHHSFELSNTKECLDTLAHCVIKDSVFIDDEDERLIFAIEALIQKGLEEDQLKAWVGSFSVFLEDHYDNNGFSLDYFKYKSNIMNFLKSLYFRLSYLNNEQSSLQVIEENLQKMHKRVYTN